MNQEITWTIGAQVVPGTFTKEQHFEKIKVDNDAPDGQKEFARRYNRMRELCLDHGLMEKK